MNDITCPVLCFVGLGDDLAFPLAVRAIGRAAPQAHIEEVGVRAGHFGLVVGSRAFGVTWPTVVAWVEHRGRLPADHPRDAAATATPPRHGAAAPLASALWERLGRLSLELTGLIDVARWERPRLARLAHVHTRLAFGPGYALARTAAESPDDTFFLWRDRAFTHREAHDRVQHLAAGLHAAGVRPGHRVGLRLDQTPDSLSALCAISLLGAELRPLAPEKSAEPGDGSEPLDHLVSDPASLPAVKDRSALPAQRPWRSRLRWICPGRRTCQAASWTTHSRSATRISYTGSLGARSLMKRTERSFST